MGGRGCYLVCLFAVTIIVLLNLLSFSTAFLVSGSKKDVIRVALIRQRWDILDTIGLGGDGVDTHATSSVRRRRRNGMT